MGVKLQLNIKLEGEDNTKAAFHAATENASNLAEKITAISEAWREFGHKAFEALEEPIKAAMENEKANVALATTLKLVGKFSEEAFEGMEHFAHSMQLVGNVSEESIKGVLRQNLAIGMSIDQAEAAEKAAMALAAVSGKSLPEANELLLQSLNGTVKGMNAWVKGADGLSLSSRRAGGAIELTLQTLGKFLGANNSTSETMERLQRSFEDVFKSAGEAFLHGLDISGRFGEIIDSVEQLQSVMDQGKPDIEAFAATIGDSLSEAIVIFKEVLQDLGPELKSLTRQFGDLAKYFILPWVDAFVSLNSIIAHFSGDTKLEEALDKLELRINQAANDARDRLNGDRQNEIDWDQVLNTEGFKKAVEKFKSPNAAGPPEFTHKWKMRDWGGPPSALGPDPSRNTPQVPKGGSHFTPLHQADSEQMKQEAAAMNLQLKQETLAMTREETNGVLADHEMRLIKLRAMEKTASDHGLNIAKADSDYRAALADWFVRHKKEAYLQDEVNATTAQGNILKMAAAKYEQDVYNFDQAVKRKQMSSHQRDQAALHSASVEIQAELEQAKKIADLGDDTYAKFEADYELQAESFNDMLEQNLMGYKAYTEQLNKIRDAADKKEDDSTGSAKMDANLGKANELLSSAKSGVNSFIGSIGQMFGIWGSIIAGILQFFNMTKVEFSKFWAGFMQALIEVVPHMFENVPVMIAMFIEKIPEMIRAVLVGMFAGFYLMLINIVEAVIESAMKMIGTVFSIGFWTSMAKDVFKAFYDALKNLWTLILTGKPLKSALDGTTADVVHDTAKFGSEDPNASDQNFKITDLNLRNQRRAGGFTDDFKKAVDEGGESLVSILGKFFKQMFDGLSDWLDSIPGKLAAGFKQATDTIGEAGRAIWHAFLDLANGAMDVFGKFGTWIYTGFMNVMNVATQLMDTVGQGIGKAMGRAIDTMVKDFTRWGGMLADGMKASMDTPFFNKLGSGIYDGLRAGLDNAVLVGHYFSFLGTNIWNGLRDGMNGANDFLKGIGDTIWQGLKAGLSTVSGGGGGGGGGVLGQLGYRGYNGGYATEGMANHGVAAAFHAAGALHFANGGMVPGTGFRDSVPAILRPGERVLTPEEQRSGMGGGGAVITLNFNVAAGAKLDRDSIRSDVVPVVAEALRRMSKNGELVIRPSGVY